MFGLFVQTCRLGLHTYASVLLFFMGFIIVIALILLLFPTFFMPMLGHLISEQCLASAVEGDTTGFGAVCATEMDEYFARHCGPRTPLNLTTYAARGRCSELDVVDDVANTVLFGLFTNVQFIAFLALLIALIIFYLLLMIVLSLNHTFKSEGVKVVVPRRSGKTRESTVNSQKKTPKVAKE